MRGFERDHAARQAGKAGELPRPALLYTVGLALLAAGSAWGKPNAALPPSEPQRAFVQTYCLACHSGRQAAGGVALDRLDPTRPARDARLWEKALVQMRAGMMPPQGAPRPGEARWKAFAASLESGIDREAALHPNPGRPALHRLNRAEYANSVRDILDVEVDVNGLLPADDMSHGFDNMAEVLKVSPTLLAGYVRAAGKISRAALGERGAAPEEEIYHLPSTLSQTRHIEGAPLGTRGGIVIRHNFPADGEYIFKTTLYFTTNTFLFGMHQKGEQVEVALNGQRVALFPVNPMMKADDDLRTPPIKVKAGPQTVTVAFVEKASGPVEDFVQPFDHSLGDLFLGRTAGLTGLPHVRDVAIKGPYHVTGVSATPSREEIFTRRPVSPSDERPCAQEILSRLAQQAYRRPLAAADTQNLMRMYDLGRRQGDWEEGVRMGLQYLLASPQFVFRFERPPANLIGGANYRLSDLELASRLSYFLWSSGPDATLLALASQNRLHDPYVLERETRRMLADPRANALAANFAGQWLHLRNLKDVQPDLFAFPNFNHNLLDSMRRETELFFGNMVREDRSVMELLTADYTFADENLARHYGIPDVEGPRFRRVKLTDPNRRGLLGQGSILTVTSFANRTSPVVRGKWIMDTLLGASPPPPPANIPPLAEITEGVKPRTVRERLQEHRSIPACASCHAKMDPLGFALENFDATGAWRTRDNGYGLDTRGQMVDGTPLNGPAGLRNALVHRSDAFLSAFTQKLLTYALGRGTEYYDMPAVRTVLHDAARQNNRFSAYVLGIVQSVPFQMRKVEVSAARSSFADTNTIHPSMRTTSVTRSPSGTSRVIGPALADTNAIHSSSEVRKSNHVHHEKAYFTARRAAGHGSISRAAPARFHGGRANAPAENRRRA